MATVQHIDGSTQHMQRKRNYRFPLGLTFTHMTLIVLGFFYLYPLLWMVAGSLKSLGGFFTQGLSIIPDAWHWENYSRAWNEGLFGQYFGNTLFVTFTTMAFTILFSSMAGFALARLQMLGKKYIIGFVLGTMLLPGGFTILPIFEIIQALGLNNTLWAVVVLNTAGGLVVNTFLFMGYFSTQTREVEEAAIVDGASIPRLYWNISLPLALPMIATIALFQFIGNWNSFFTPLVFTLGNPDLRTLAVGMYAFTGEHSQQWTLTCAGATISLIPIIIVFLFLQRYFVEGIAGAVK